jgi:hypothetical protein
MPALGHPLMYNHSFWISRRTYDATLAELTSLEEMMRIMMEENHIHYDVIAKLWQIYSMFFFVPCLVIFLTCF